MKWYSRHCQVAGWPEREQESTVHESQKTQSFHRTLQTQTGHPCAGAEKMCESGRPWITANKLCDHQLAHSSCPSISWTPDFVMVTHANWWHSAWCSEGHFCCLLLRYETLHGVKVEEKVLNQVIFGRSSYNSLRATALDWALLQTPHIFVCLPLENKSEIFTRKYRPSAFSVSCLLRSLWQQCLSGFICNFH